MIESTYTVTGMTCGHCVRSVTEGISTIDGVDEVDVDLATGRVIVTAHHPVPDDEVHAAVIAAGYEFADGRR
ncbi:heavy-metal-associated domain-containing protein [Kutzneria buriramensis]|uniref:Copper chaperone CopZ n=1 Tax=Kutzneria buriramensis TaxID=1045776 RepID=A0A3E0H2K0_9PSEU|nr:heavy metal-associated domain-containing protein [Kutzneria buriramensis]REH36260.1 copper chaperone CopZ [Kutzneria buriramensis]